MCGWLLESRTKRGENKNNLSKLVRQMPRYNLGQSRKPQPASAQEFEEPSKRRGQAPSTVKVDKCVSGRDLNRRSFSSSESSPLLAQTVECLFVISIIIIVKFMLRYKLIKSLKRVFLTLNIRLQLKSTIFVSIIEFLRPPGSVDIIKK